MSIVGILVALGIVVAVNYLATRQSKRWDLTENQAYSLSDQTVKVLQGLDAPVQITVFDQETGFDDSATRLDDLSIRVEQRQGRVRRHRSATRRAPSRPKCSSSARS